MMKKKSKFTELGETYGWMLAILVSIFTLYVNSNNQKIGIDQVNENLELTRKQNSLYEKDRFYSVWAKVDEVLIEHPELSSVWLEDSVVLKIKKEDPKDEDRKKFYQRRAFASSLMFIYFREYELKKNDTVGRASLKNIDLRYQDSLFTMWNKYELSDDYDTRFSDFVTFADSCLFKGKKYYAPKTKK